ncbi:hypothetical protein HY78_14650 [Rhizorhabdus wittichii DC-6]|nr:hypothetical protein HY78_14650 [Rhizorhabdus wittichii DC-6]
MKLIIMACSATKRPDPGIMPAIRRYDGPMWRTLRARLAELPRAQAAIQSGELRITVLSALHGFIMADAEIADYEQRMTAERAAQLVREPTAKSVRPLVQAADAVLFAGGELYRDAMWRAYGGSLWHLMAITETDAGGIGRHRVQLGQWLSEHFGPRAIAEAAQRKAAA